MPTPVRVVLTGLTLLLLPLPSCSGEEPAQHRGLRAFYPLSRTATDVAGGHDRAEVLGAVPVADRFGREGHAFAFTDGAAIDAGHVFTDLAVPFSVSAWVRREEVSPRIAAVVSSNEGTDVYTGFWMQVHPDGRLELSYGDGGPRKHSSRRTKVSADRVPVGRWTHLTAVVRGPADMSLYVDGVDAGGEHSGEGGPLVNGDFPALIGRGNEGAGVNAWLGAIDEVRVYERALSPEEARSLYAGGSPAASTAWPRIGVVDAAGQTVAVAHGSDAASPSALEILSALPPGSYVLHVATSDSTFTRKVAIE